MAMLFERARPNLVGDSREPVGRPKQFRRVATHYVKLAMNGAPR